MYLHLGQDTVIKMDEIIGIFDMDTSTLSKTTCAYPVSYTHLTLPTKA